jgi:hypothetical protein
VKRYVTEVVAENLVLLGGTANSNCNNGNGGGGKNRSERRPTRGKAPNGHREREPESAGQGLENDDVLM